MWFLKKKKKVEEVKIEDIPTTDDPEISCFAKGIGKWLDSPTHKWSHYITSIRSSSSFTCNQENFYLFIGRGLYGRFELSAQYGELSKKDKDFLIEKLRKKFPDNVIDQSKRDEVDRLNKIKRISDIGCSQNKS